MKYNLTKVKQLLVHISFELFNTKLYIAALEDKKFEDVNHGRRMYLQVFYHSPCSKTGEIKEWKGRKWYLSEYMTESEIVFTAFAAFEMAVTHEIYEAFKFDNVIVINPHIDFRKLLEVSPHEVERKHIENFDV
jgi:hypothetical protein